MPPPIDQTSSMSEDNTYISSSEDGEAIDSNGAAILVLSEDNRESSEHEEATDLNGGAILVSSEDNGESSKTDNVGIILISSDDDESLEGNDSGQEQSSDSDQEQSPAALDMKSKSK